MSSPGGARVRCRDRLPEPPVPRCRGLRGVAVRARLAGVDHLVARLRREAHVQVVPRLLLDQGRRDKRVLLGPQVLDLSGDLRVLGSELIDLATVRDVLADGVGQRQRDPAQDDDQDRRAAGELRARGKDRPTVRRSRRPVPAHWLRADRGNAPRPAYAAPSLSSSSIRSSWLYLATRSDRHGAPVLIWPQLSATTRSAIVVSSVSPERWLIIVV